MKFASLPLEVVGHVKTVTVLLRVDLGVLDLAITIMIDSYRQKGNTWFVVPRNTPTRSWAEHNYV